MERGVTSAGEELSYLAPRDSAEPEHAQHAGAARGALLEVTDLCIDLEGRGRRTRVVDELAFELCPGQTLAIVGESGAGKSLTCRALLGLLPEGATITGSIRLHGKELVALSDTELRRHRGSDISMALQETDRSLNPTMQIGRQITEAMLAHQRSTRTVVRQRALALLESLNLSDPTRVFSAYAHELSGGMRQRVILAIALACEPRLLILDEATRSLDVTTQSEVMTLLARLQKRNGVAIIMVSHDLRLAMRFADEVLVMRGGRLVERAPPQTLFGSPRTPYASALVAALPSLERPPRRPHGGGASEPASSTVRPMRWAESGGALPPSRNAPLLVVRNLTHRFAGSGWRHSTRSGLPAVADVSFEIRPAETLGVAGESGSGKSTLARAIVQMPRPSSGQVMFSGRELTTLNAKDLRDVRRRIQMIFQDPLGSLNPKWRVIDIVEEPLRGYGIGSAADRRNRVNAVLERVGLPPAVFGSRRPRQLSGGQSQRVAVARALVVEPDLLICDEVVSSLDVLAQAQILELLARLRMELGLSCLFISHDLAALRQLSDRIAILYLGQLCEIGATESLYQSPAHPFTRLLLASAVIDGDGIATRAVPGSSQRAAAHVPDVQRGCQFRERCASAQTQCAAERPALTEIGPDHWVACHFPVRRERTFAPASG